LGTSVLHVERTRCGTRSSGKATPDSVIPYPTPVGTVLECPSQDQHESSLNALALATDCKCGAEEQTAGYIVLLCSNTDILRGHIFWQF